MDFLEVEFVVGREQYLEGVVPEHLDECLCLFHQSIRIGCLFLENDFF